MNWIAIKTACLATLLLMPVASRLEAGGQQTPPAPPAPAMAPETPEPPEPPAPPAHRRHKALVDGDRVMVWSDGDEPDVVVEGSGDDWDAELPGMHFSERGRGYIGLRPIEMTPELRQHFGAPKDAGVLVGSVDADGPAARAGLQVADVVTSVDGERVDSTRDLIRAIRRQKEGAKVKLQVVRTHAKRDLTVTVGKRRDDLELGELGRRFRGWGKGIERVMPRLESLPDLHGIQERLKDLEERLKELESRIKK